MNGRRGKLCSQCHLPGHNKVKCTQAPCGDFQSCGKSEKHPEAKTEIYELQKLVKELEKKESKASAELQTFKIAKERAISDLFSVMRPRLRKPCPSQENLEKQDPVGQIKED